jgi:hypothetical protein
VVSSRRANAGLWLSQLNRRLRHPISNHTPDGTDLFAAHIWIAMISIISRRLVAKAHTQ